MKSTLTIRTFNDLEKFLGISIFEDDFGVKLPHKSMIGRMLTFLNMVYLHPPDTPIPVWTNLLTEVTGMELCESEKLFQHIVGSLMHLSNITRPGISYSVLYISLLMHKRTIYTRNAAKRVLQYSKGTQSMRLRYMKQGDETLRHSLIPTGVKRGASEST